jgi:hypothetical protein
MILKLRVNNMVDMDAIKEDAKRIMDNFLEALDKADLPDAPLGVERELFQRIPKEEESDGMFTKKILANAPKTKDDCILTEKKSW